MSKSALILTWTGFQDQEVVYPYYRLIAAGFDADSVEKVTRLIKLNEYKRRQAPPGVRVTTRAFGRDWRYPITSQFRA